METVNTGAVPSEAIQKSILKVAQKIAENYKLDEKVESSK